MRIPFCLSIFAGAVVYPLLAQSNHTPTAVEKVKPEKKPDASVERAIIDALDLRHKFRDEPTRYEFNRVDLNGDGEPEIVIYLLGKNMCAAAGCTSMVFQKQGNAYKVIAQLGLTRTPVFVSQHATNGWQDLIVQVNGTLTMPGYYAVLPFSGRAYPENPALPPAEPLDTSQPATAYLSGGAKGGFKIPLPDKN